VHPPLSSALFGSSESSLLVTLSDRHHLDGSVVIGGTKTTGVLVGGSCQACEWFWVIHRDGVLKNQPVESTWSLLGPRGSKTLARVL